MRKDRCRPDRIPDPKASAYYAMIPPDPLDPFEQVIFDELDSYETTELDPTSGEWVPVK